MYELLVENKELIMAAGLFAYIVFAILALGAAYMFQGNDKRTFTGPMYTTIFTLILTFAMLVGAEYLINSEGKWNMAFGIPLMIFSSLILFTIPVLCFMAKNHKPDVWG